MVIEPISTSELLTVAEFAKAADKSAQHIYRLLSTKLQPYVTIVNEQKMLKSEALQLFTPDTTFDNGADNRLTTALQQTIDTQAAHIEQLYLQLAVKDEQIKSASDSLHESHVITLQLTDRQQQLLQAAIDEADAETTHTDMPEPPPDVPTQPVKRGLLSRLFNRRKPT